MVAIIQPSFRVVRLPLHVQARRVPLHLRQMDRLLDTRFRHNRLRRQRFRCVPHRTHGPSAANNNLRRTTNHHLARHTALREGKENKKGMETPKQPKSPILQELRRILVDAIKRIDADECSESQALGMLSRFNAETKGFVDKHSTVNYDEAMRMLGIKNRNVFKALCDVHDIKQVRINNQAVGFLVSEIESLKRFVNG